MFVMFADMFMTRRRATQITVLNLARFLKTSLMTGFAPNAG